jgi:ornithine cyclodeaminase/alanine dehydrogenase-like protein (mu-crystallin family)
MNNSFSIITAEVINNIVNNNPDKIYEAVKTAYMRYGQNQAVNPPSYFLNFPDKKRSRIIALPASIMQNPRIAGIKWIASNPDNLTTNLKRASAVIILNDYETGYPFACLEGAVISALRTVYSAILVSNLLIVTRQLFWSTKE